MITLTALIVTGLAAWRYAHFIVADELFAPIREGLLKRYENFVNQKDKKRNIHKRLWIKLEVLLVCIYCATFWTTLLTYNFFVWFTNIGAIWGLATLIGVTHNYFFTDEVE